MDKQDELAAVIGTALGYLFLPTSALDRAAAAVRSFMGSDEVVERGWSCLKDRCCSDPKKAKRCVMVSNADFRAALSAQPLESMARKSCRTRNLKVRSVFMHQEILS